MLRPSDGAAPFEAQPLEAGMFCLFRAHLGATGIPLQSCPFRLARVLRVADEVHRAPFVVVEPYWPLLRPQKYGSQVNLFGTWTRGMEPITDGDRPSKKRRADQQPGLMVDWKDVLVWPVDAEPRVGREPEGLRIPFPAFGRLRYHGVDVATPAFTFSKRGREFFFDMCRDIAEHLHDAR